MEMKKQKKIIGGMILVLAVTACASFFKSAAEEIAQEFHEKLQDHCFPGIGLLSRKKQLVPKLTAAIRRAKEKNR